MKNYTVIKLSNMWSTEALTNNVEKLLNEKASQGFEVVSVAFGRNLWYAPTVFITLCKE